MLVTCICVCHDKPEFAHEAIQSIVDQSYPHWEALIVDSGVLYDSGYYEQFPWRHDPRIHLIRSTETPKLRGAKAMASWCFNECFRTGLVRGDLVMYLCDDDILYRKTRGTSYGELIRHRRDLAKRHSHYNGRTPGDGHGWPLHQRPADGLRS